VNLKSSTRCCEILVFVERFFRHIIYADTYVDTYAEREEHRSRGKLLSRHLSDGDYELDLAIFVTYHTIPNMNESNNKFYFTKDDVEIIIPKDSYEVRDINEFLKRAKRKRPHHDALETVDVVRGDNNNDTDDDDDDDNY